MSISVLYWGMMLAVWFVIGAGMGSVANALIDRLPRGESWVKGRSHCDKCGHVLNIFDLIPLLSFVWLRGKCRYCHKPISVRNFVVELILGLAFVVIIGHSLAYNSLSLAAIFFVTVVIAVMDWETRLVSEWLVLIWGGLVVVGGGTGVGNVWGTLVGVGVIGGIWVVTRGRAMGFGDVEIATVMGWWLGWRGIAVALWVAFVSGAIIGVVRVIRGIGGIKSEIAFGPFLLLGSWVAYFWGNIIWRWVFRF